MTQRDGNDPDPIAEFYEEEKTTIDYGWGLVGIAVVIIAIAAPSEIVQILGGRGQPGFGNTMGRATEMWQQITDIQRLGMASAWAQSAELCVRLAARVMVIWMLWRCMRSAIHGKWRTMVGWGVIAVAAGVANGVFNPWLSG